MDVSSASGQVPPLKRSTLWKVALAAIWAVSIYWAIAFLVLIAAEAAHLYSGSDVPFVIGGIVISLIGFVFTVFVNAEGGFVDWLEHYMHRQMANEAARMSMGYTEVNRMTVKWRGIGTTFRNAVIASNVFLIVVGIALAVM